MLEHAASYKYENVRTRRTTTLYAYRSCIVFQAWHAANGHCSPAAESGRQNKGMKKDAIQPQVLEGQPVA